MWRSCVHAGPRGCHQRHICLKLSKIGAHVHFSVRRLHFAMSLRLSIDERLGHAFCRLADAAKARAAPTWQADP
jgi:aromatic ring-cleaving dioxygenase